MIASKKKRWMKSVLAAAARCDAALPWERGESRSGMIQRRDIRRAASAPLLRQAAAAR